MIYTSYFYRFNYLKLDCVSIANKQPNKFYLEKYDDLIPSWNLVERYKIGFIDVKEYTDEYMLQLTKLNPNKILNDLNGKCLLCWENPKSFCHRHLVRNWLKNNNIDSMEILYYE